MTHVVAAETGSRPVHVARGTGGMAAIFTDTPRRTRPHQKDQDPVLLAGLESFPASDPPSWLGMRTGRPVERQSSSVE